MYHHWDIQAYLKGYNDHLHMLNKRIMQLEKYIPELQKEIETLKHNQQPANIEYKFDQLKVERLEGTLNIGLSPQTTGEAIEDFSVNQNHLNVPMHGEQSPLFDHILAETHRYLENDCLPIIEQLETKHNYPLEPEYRQFIITDIKKQIHHRVQHYLNQVNLQSLTKEQQKDIESQIVIKVKEDIHKTFDLYIQNLPKGNGGN